MTAVSDAPPVVIDDEDDDDDRPSRPRSLNAADHIELSVAAAAGATVTLGLALVFDWTHPVTLVVLFVLTSLAFEWLLLRDRTTAAVATDRVVQLAIWSTAAVAVGVLAWMVIFVAAKGIPGLRTSFFTEDLSKSGPLNPGGGALHAIIGTIEQTALATAVAIPVGVLTSVYLHELRGRFAGIVRLFANAMSGLPSILAGLLIYTAWVSDLDMGFSGLAGSMALIVVMLPVVIRTSEEILRTVPDGLRESALALGYPQWRMVLRVVLPTARTGLVTAGILSVARAIGETPPVLFTAFGTSSINLNPFHGTQSDLPLFIWGLLKQPNAVQIQRAWTGALVLVSIVMFLFLSARVLSGRGERRRNGGRT